MESDTHSSYDMFQLSITTKKFITKKTKKTKANKQLLAVDRWLSSVQQDTQPRSQGLSSSIPFLSLGR